MPTGAQPSRFVRVRSVVVTFFYDRRRFLDVSGLGAPNENRQM